MSSYRASLALQLALLRARLLPRFALVIVIASAIAPVLLGDAPEGGGYQALAGAGSLLVAEVAGLAAVLGGVAVAGDVSNGALRSVLLRPVPRGSYLGALATVLVGFTALLYVAGILAALLAVSWTVGFGDVSHEGYTILTAQEMSTFAWRLLPLPLAPLLCAPLIALAVSVVIDDQGTAVLVSLTAVEGPFIVRQVVAPLPPEVFSEGAARPMAALADLARGVTLEADTVAQASYAGEILQHAAIWGVAAFALAWLLWQRREVRA